MSALEHLTSTAGCLSQITALAGEQRYQMDNDFRVRVGLENHPFTTEFLAQFEVVFNDTIVNDDVLAVHTDVRMRVSLTWLAVGLTVYSGVGYLAVAWPMLKGSEPPAST